MIVVEPAPGSPAAIADDATERLVAETRGKLLRRPWWELLRLVALALAAIVLARMVGRLGDVVGLILLAATVAFLTDPLRRRFARRLGPGTSAALNALVTLLVVVALAAVLFRDIAAQASRLTDAIVETLRDLRPGTLPAQVAESLEAEQGVRDAFDRLPAVVVAGEDDVSGVGRQAIDVLLIVILAAFFQSSATGFVDWAVSHWRRADRKSARELLDDIERRGGTYARRTVLLGIAVTIVVAASTWIVDVPGGVVFGTWAGLCIVVPSIGWILGVAPILIAGYTAGVPEGLALTVVCALLVAGVAVARRRLEHKVDMRLGPALSLIAVAAGIATGGFGGALVAFVAMSVVGAALTTQFPFVQPVRDDDDAVPTPSGADALARVEDGRVVMAPGWRGAFTLLGAIVGGVLLWMLAGHLGGVVVWLAIAVLVAVALSRPVGWIARRLHVPRAVAVAGVSLAAIAVVSIVGVAAVQGGADTSSELAEELPSVVEELEEAPLIGPWLRDRDAAIWVSEQMENLPQRLEEARDVSDWLPTITARVLDLFWTILIALVLLLDGPRLVRSVERRVPAVRRRQFTRLIEVSRHAISGYLVGAALVAGLNATVVFTIAISLGVALAPVLAIWAFIWNFVPQIGGFMGGFPLVVLALAAGPLQAIIAGVLFVTYQFIENHLIQPAVISEAIDVPAWATLLAALAGGAAAGVIGAVVLTPLVGVVRVVIDEMRRDDFPGATVPEVTDEINAAASAGAHSGPRVGGTSVEAR